MAKLFEHVLTKNVRQEFSVPTYIGEQPQDDMIDPEWLTKVSSQYGFLTALMQSAATQSIFTTENGRRKYKHVDYDCDDNGKRVLVGKSIWTELPEDIGTACCHTKPDVNGELMYASPAQLCLKDCYDNMTEHWRRMTRQNISLFGGVGSEAEYWAELRAWFVFFQARDIMYGKVGVTGNNIPSFPGVLDMMDKATVTFSGTDIIGAFEQIGCRIGLLRGNYVFGAHPILIDSIKKAVRRGGVYYEGFAMNGNTLTYNGFPFVEDINIPLNIETGTGQIWAADLNKNGVFLEYNMSQPEQQTIDQYQDSQSGQCFSTCNFLKNYGFAFTKDYNSLFRITDVPLNGACLGEQTLLGLGQLIQPDTLVPDYD